jgi:rubredoxin
MIQFNITDFRRVETARIAIDRVAVVAGLNGNGKSSLAQAMGISLTGERMPAELGLTKLAECGVLVRSGAPEASLAVAFLADGAEEPYASARMTYPNPEYKQGQGEPIRCSRYAVGLESVLDLDDKKRAMELARILKTEPSFADLLTEIRRADIIAKDGTPKDPIDEAEAKHMEELGLNPDSNYDLITYRYVAEMWRDIQGTGWDSVLKTVREAGRKYKSHWELTTGEKAYQPTGADTWLPQDANWDSALLSVSKESLQRDITDARDMLEGEIAKGAVDQHEVTRLQADIDAYVFADHEKARTTLAQYEDEIPKEEAKLAALPKPEDVPVVVCCPHCGADSQLVTETGKPPRLQADIVGITAEENAARRKAIDDQQAIVTRYKTSRDGWAAQVQRWQQSKRGADDAKVKLDELLARPDNSATIDAARKAVAKAEIKLELRDKKEKADKYHRAVQGNQKVIDILAPEGLRKAKLTKVLESFNAAILGDICTALGFRPVVLDEAMRFKYAGFPYGLAAKSEQWRIRAVVQLAIAKLEGAPLVVLDGADILAPPNRWALIKGVMALGIPAVITMTLAAPEKMPPMWKQDGAQAYWMDNGVARRVVNVADGKAVLE